MSGFIGILNGDGQPIDFDLLHRMTDLMLPQGPDAQETWGNAHIGFGHALLRTTWESETERQPHSLDGEVWITGDIRLDRRDELIDRLRASGCRFDKEVPDVDLMLHAYRVWEADCVERVSGDFAFAIWDSRSQRLFCARDHFGIVPFYYAKTKNALILGNHINCLRLHPQVSDHLNERAIGDFLLASMNLDFTTTVFADIRKLPPAHTLIWSDGKLRVQRYWQLPEVAQEYVRYSRREEYIERFRELFERAITDRLRTDRVGTYLSGGMDSTSVAATAYRLMTATDSSVDFRAYTIIFNALIFDDEGDYAAQVAEKAGFSIEYLAAEDYVRQAPEKRPEYPFPEPLAFSSHSAELEIMRRVAGYSRVLLSGMGGDPALTLPWSHWISLLRRNQLSRLARDTLEYIRAFHRPPGFGLRTQMRGWLREWRDPFDLPDWIKPDYVERIGLKARYREFMAAVKFPPMRSHYGMLAAPLWSHIFATAAPGFAGPPTKTRYPFFDVRLVSYLQSIPPIPWLERKFLLREAMKGILPKTVRLRPKRVLRSNPHYSLMRQRGVQPWMEELLTIPAIAPYVDGECVLQRLRAKDFTSITYRQIYLALVLAYWLNLENDKQG
ncbi:asparagine synthetase B family protein [Candidatus Thiosymbion oneisti]|uniref:asparagine synthetase B family protein n=1 Tax=Candidatus Thiosymbion oneisti TaxID=589554 RepID=UPI000B03CD3E|nr:asparagine synthase-related protein [Candidatus Thiosymbion oneisti]